jgi:hypothetical protein
VRAARTHRFGIVAAARATGFSDDTFGPTASIERQAVEALLHRFHALLG